MNIVLPDWMREAACHDTPRDVFFPSVLPNRIRDRGLLLDRQWDEARTYCNRCPVRAECLEFAIDTDTRTGMYGGKTPDERATIQRRRLESRCEF